MRRNTKTSAVGLLALTYRASAQVAKSSPSDGVTFGLNIPEATAASAEAGEIFFQISAPSSYEWVALGQGSGMAKSNIFVVYTSADGNNVTLSPRTTNSYSAPSFNDAAQVTLLEGSGVANGVMTANVRCSNCNSWSGGTMDFTSNSGNFIYAYQSSGGPMNDDSTSASIRQHNNEGVFNWEFAAAKGGSSVNPLINTSPSATTGGTGATPTSCRQRPSGAAATASGSVSSAQSSQTASYDDDDWWKTGRPTARPTSFPPGSPYDKRQSDDSSLPYCDTLPNNDGANSGVTTISSSEPDKTKYLIAHGVLASLAFVILFPAGSIAIRLASFPGVLWFHALFQIFAYLTYIAAFGLGIWLALPVSGGHYIDSHHAIIGMLVFALIFFQPFLGWMHHALFKKYNHRTLWSYAHIWVGRIAITLGIINGGLGLLLAGNSRDGEIAYGVVAGVMWVTWVAAAVWGEMRRKKTAKVAAAQNPEKLTGERRQSDNSASGGSDTDLNGHYRPAKEQQA
ncbi:hypothetical protein G6011_08533 [Alternaria panax]|uniref:DOMON domain-containing protein n=1 Tax=Alternaria panax TaxID=48097 RepID=A0AAD4FJC4_9PLEO|nr:hypothetical protein G6011_08533 [Alternaria panax]